jgi:hypothetical protein
MALTFVHRDLALAGDRLERPSCAARSTAPGSSPPSRATGFSAGADVGFHAFLPIAASLLTIGNRVRFTPTEGANDADGP